MTLSAVAASEEWWTAVTCEALRMLTAQVESLHIQKRCVPLFCTQLNVPHGCYLASVCVCVCVCAYAFLCERLACRGGWSGLENILCDSTSGLASLSADIPLSLPHCNSSTVHSLCFVQVPVSEGDDVTTHELCEFRGLPKGGLERFSVCTKKEWEHKYKYKVLLGL